MQGLPLCLSVKNLPAMRETWIRFLGWEDSLEKEMATHSSILAWRIPWTEDPGQATVHGVARVGHELATKPTTTIAYVGLETTTLSQILRCMPETAIATIPGHGQLLLNQTSLCCCCCSVTKSYPPLWDPMYCSTPGSSFLHCLPEFVHIHVH